MDRSIGVSLKDFATIPHSLRAQATENVCSDTCRCDLARLFHHYYLDTYGRRPPNPNPAQFEYVQFLSDCDDFRLAGDGIGASTAARRNISTALGQAFCRWFLHDHLNITYFAHMDKVLNKSLPQGFGGVRIERATTGDAPDYLCAESVDKVFLAEAKGRYTSISFTNKDFGEWRKQFSRIRVHDQKGIPISLKGFIVGTRFVTEENRHTLKSTIFAEDPQSRGDTTIGGEESSYLSTLR